MLDAFQIAGAIQNQFFRISMVARSERYLAQQQGLTTYVTGRPCTKGHLAERFTQNGCCAECIRIRLREKRRAQGIEPRTRMPDEEFKAKRRALNRCWKERNRERLAKEARAYYSANKERCDARNRTYSRLNCTAGRQRAKAHKAKRKGAEGSHTAAQVRELFRRQRGQCMNCRADLRPGFHEDHIMPLSRGGSNYITNIQLLCAPCNLAKRAKHPIIWAQENGRLL